MAQWSQITSYTTQEGLTGNFITALAFAPDGSVWVGTTEGATRISDAGWYSFTRAHGLGDRWITSLAVTTDGRVWLGTQGGGLSVFDPIAQTITTYNLENSNIPSNFVTALVVTEQNRLWLGTLHKGVAQYDPAQNTWAHYDLPNNAVTALAWDANERLWVGTERGVFYNDGAKWIRDRRIGETRVRRIDAFDGYWYLTNEEGRYILSGEGWKADDGADPIGEALKAAGLNDGQLTAFGQDRQGRIWLGTARGLRILHRGNAPRPPQPLPTLLIHGWTVAGDDTLETSEFRFLQSYAARDGIPLFYARGISPKNTLYQNAEVLRDEIARVKRETGAPRVNLIAFSMGGMNARALLESSLFQNDVNRAILLGTPQAGVEMWKPILMQQILQKPDEPSAIELSPEYAEWVNQTRSPNPDVPYDLLIGDARKQPQLEFLDAFPAGDALISVESALALDAPNVRKHINADLHDWSPQAIPFDLTGYLYPRDTYERYLRNALRNPGIAPIGSEVLPSLEKTPEPSRVGGNHTPVVTNSLRVGETITRSLWLDESETTRFIAYFPGGKIDFSLRAPDGTLYESNARVREGESNVLSLQTDLANFSGYVIRHAPAGEWKLTLTRTDKDGKGDTGDRPIDILTYVDLDASRTLHARLHTNVLDLGETNIITAYVTLASGSSLPPTQEVNMRARLAVPGARLGDPFTFVELALFDDGQHNDGAANDGYFANTYRPTRAGWHLAFVRAAGSDFERETEMLFAVNPGGAKFAGAVEMQRKGERFIFDVPLRIERGGDYLMSLSATPQTGMPYRFITPLRLERGTPRVTLALDARRVNAGQVYRIDFRLLDASGAAIPVDEFLNAYTLQP